MGKTRLGVGGQWAPWPRLDGVPWHAEDDPKGLPYPPKYQLLLISLPQLH